MYPDSSIRRILIYRLGSLGDTMVALPCFHLIARRFPQAERVLLTNFPVEAKAPTAAAILDGSELIQGYMRYTVGTRRISELLRLATEIRRFRPDLIVYLMPLRPRKIVRRICTFLRLASGARWIVGVPSEQELQRRFDATTGLYEPEAQRLARMIAELGEAHADDLANWDLRLNAAEIAAAESALAPLADRPFIVCAPGCKMLSNDWGQENWRTLLARLSRSYSSSYALVMAGAKQDSAVCDYAAQDWAGTTLHLAGRLNPRESAAVFSRAAAFLGPDSGPKHLAASQGVACVCVFGARDLPGVWFPPGTHNQIVYHRPDCSGCGLETCIERKQQCIRSLTIDEMEQAVRSVLAG
ncbi:MAG: glycosyltransferase family 9 protein [Acidobacteriaceae bacterium]|nr:glycosyltransferase family 9 protein [Acidobacteriaceae bacterium]